MTQDTPSLRDLVAAPVDIPVGAIKLAIKPLGWYESIDCIDCIAPALATMPMPPQSGQDIDLPAWLGWAANHRDAVVQFCALASGQPEDAVQAIGPMDLVQLVFGLFEVNADFFIASLPGAIASMAARVGGMRDRVHAVMAKLPSSTSSSSSSNTGTASTA